MNSLPIRIASIPFALIAGVAALILLIERFNVLENPGYVPSCSWNPIFSCTGPMASWQSHAIFEIPNYAIGIAGFTSLLAVLALSFGVELKKWVWIGYIVGALFATTYCFWLMTQTLYVINALCIYCIVTWACSLTLFWLGIKGLSNSIVEAGSLRNWWNATTPANSDEDELNQEFVLSISEKFFYWLSRLVPALMTAHILVIVLMVYLRFYAFFNYLLGFTDSPVG